MSILSYLFLLPIHEAVTLYILQYDQEFSSGDHTAPGSPDDMFLKDLNPCLTPYYKTKSMVSTLADIKIFWHLLYLVLAHKSLRSE